MNDITVIIVLFALMNKNGFSQLKSAIKTVESISSGLGNISGIVNMLPAMQNIMSNMNKSENSADYIDTLKDVIENISGK